MKSFGFTNIFDIYPCNDYLNNALRFLLREEKSHNIDLAISEICWAIKKANGVFADDIKEEIIKRNLFIFN